MEGSAEQIIRRAHVALMARDLDALERITDPEVEVATATAELAGRSGPYRGHAGLHEYVADIGRVWTRLELDPRQFHTIDEERTLVFGRVRAWRGSTFIDLPNAVVWTIRDGLVAAVELLASPDRAREAYMPEAGLAE